MGYTKFMLRFKTEVMDLKDVTNEERYQALILWTKGNAKMLVEQFTYNTDRGFALNPIFNMGFFPNALS